MEGLFGGFLGLRDRDGLVSTPPFYRIFKVRKLDILIALGGCDTIVSLPDDQNHVPSLFLKLDKSEQTWYDAAFKWEGMHERNDTGPLLPLLWRRHRHSLLGEPRL